MLQDKDRKRILDYVNGALVYYGIIEADEMLELVRENLNLQVDKKDFAEIMKEASLDEEDDNLVIDCYKNYLFNFYLEDQHYILREQKARKDITFRPISEKAALSALPLEGNSNRNVYTGNLIRFLAGKGWSEESAAERVLELELDFNNGTAHMELIQSILGDIEFDDEKEVGGLMNLLNGFFNNMPQWILKGWPSREIFERFEKPKLKPLPDKPYQQLSMVEQGQGKVGRNDPCPCGSGKKYKKCCLNQATDGYKERSPRLLEASSLSETGGQAGQEFAGQVGSSGEEAEREPTIEEWAALYDAAIDLKAMKCWEWMHEDELFGVKNPETGEIAYISIMGEIEQVYSINAYLGADGLSSFYNFLDCDDQDEAMHHYLNLYCLVASFENREDLHEKDMEVIKSLGLKFRGKKHWPRFRSHRPGCIPWFINSAECRFITAIIRQAIVVADRCRDNHGLLIDKPDRILIRTLKGSGKSADWCDTYSPVIDPSRTYTSYSLTDELNVRKILKTAKKTNAIWEADTFYLMNPIKEKKDDRPYLPTVFLIVESEEAIVIGYELIAYMSEDALKCVDRLVVTIEQTKCVPKTVVVEKKELYYCLLDVCQQLNLELKLVDKLKVLPEIRKEISRLKKH